MELPNIKHFQTEQNYRLCVAKDATDGMRVLQFDWHHTPYCSLRSGGRCDCRGLLRIRYQHGTIHVYHDGFIPYPDDEG